MLIECGERGKITSGFPQVIARSVFLLLVLSISTLVIGVLFTVGNGYHRLVRNQSNTILSQCAGLDAKRDERCVTPIKYLTAFGFYFVCVPIQKHPRILFYGRYSKDEQRKFSIEDQLLYCKEFLTEMDVDVSSIDELSDRGTSGEHHSRPGIDQVLKGIVKRKWDLIICEDSSRLYRGISPCMNLFGPAVDNDIRLICINDKVDTANDDWPQRLEEAQRHHGQDNYYTRYRIKRTQDGLWAMGAAMGPLRPGYERNHSTPENHKDPKYDRIAPQWMEMIRTAFQMVADDLRLDAVARKECMRASPDPPSQLRPIAGKSVATSIRYKAPYGGASAEESRAKASHPSRPGQTSFSQTREDPLGHPTSLFTLGVGGWPRPKAPVGYTVEHTP